MRECLTLPPAVDDIASSPVHVPITSFLIDYPALRYSNLY